MILGLTWLERPVIISHECLRKPQAQVVVVSIFYSVYRCLVQIRNRCECVSELIETTQLGINILLANVYV